MPSSRGRPAPGGPADPTGHGFDASGQIVLAPGTLAAIHKEVGDTVTVRYGTTTPHRLTIVGTATMPAIGVGGVTGHASLGTGARRWITSSFLLPSATSSACPRRPQRHLRAPQARRGCDGGARGLNHIAGKLSLPTNYSSVVLPAQRPAEIVNYRSMGSTPRSSASGSRWGR